MKKTYDVTLPPGPTLMTAGRVKQKAQKHPEFDAVVPHMPATLAEPDFVGRHPADGSFSFVKRVPGLPGENAAVLIAIKSRREKAGHYEIKSAYGVTEEALARWAAAGNLREPK